MLWKGKEGYGGHDSSSLPCAGVATARVPIHRRQALNLTFLTASMTACQRDFSFDPLTNFEG